jgi:indolepyruvate ferredoxin oxidoreductase alpha subunit
MCGLCGNCRACIDLFGCPALAEQNGRVVVDPVLCTGCGVCAEICPNDAFRAVPHG